MASILNDRVEEYILDLAPARDRVLREMEALAEDERIPIVGPAVGGFLALLARMVHARTVFELGSAIGYSTIWWARAVGPEGRVFYTDGDPLNAERARHFLERAGVKDRVEVMVGDALTLLAATPGQFDIVFNDVDKWEYPRVLEQAVPRVRVGGLLVTDNTLWSARVVEKDADEWTTAVQEYNRAAAAAPNLATSIIPLRDGVSVSLRLAE